MTRTKDLCTFHRDGVWCARQEADETVHVWPDERMRPGAHVWRHEPKDAARMTEAVGTLAHAEAQAKAAVSRALDPLPQAARERVVRALVERFGPQ